MTVMSMYNVWNISCSLLPTFPNNFKFEEQWSYLLLAPAHVTFVSLLATVFSLTFSPYLFISYRQRGDRLQLIRNSFQYKVTALTNYILKMTFKLNECLCMLYIWQLSPYRCHRSKDTGHQGYQVLLSSYFINLLFYIVFIASKRYKVFVFYLIWLWLKARHCFDTNTIAFETSWQHQRFSTYA